MVSELAASPVSLWNNEFEPTSVLPSVGASSGSKPLAMNPKSPYHNAKSIKFPSMASTTKSKSRNQVEDIQEEMKLLNWHKLANEAALKAALMKCKKMKEEESATLARLSKEKDKWKEQIIYEETQKPLNLTTEELRFIEQKEKQKEEKLEQQIERHIQSLTKLKKVFDEHTKARECREKYMKEKEQYYELFPEERKLHEGGSRGMKTTTIREEEREEEGLNKGEKKENEDNPLKNVSNILTNIEQLVQLEKRIAQLEDNPKPAIKKKVGMNKTKQAQGRQTNCFKKKPQEKAKAKRVVRPTRNKRQLYSFQKNKPKSCTVIQSSKRLGVVRNKNKTSSTFMTGLAESNKIQIKDNKKVVYLHRMSEKEKRLYNKEMKKEKEIGKSKRQDQIIKNWLQKKNGLTGNVKAKTTSTSATMKERERQRKTSMENTKAKTGSGRLWNARPMKNSISNGKKTSNKLLEEFQGMKKEHEKNKERVVRHARITTKAVQRQTNLPSIKPVYTSTHSMSKTTQSTISIRQRPSQIMKSSIRIPPSMNTTGTQRINSRIKPVHPTKPDTKAMTLPTANAASVPSKGGNLW